MIRTAARFAVITAGLGMWFLLAHLAVAFVVWAVAL
jgi:hypothetical protein